MTLKRTRGRDLYWIYPGCVRGRLYDVVRRHKDKDEMSGRWEVEDGTVLVYFGDFYVESMVGGMNCRTLFRDKVVSISVFGVYV